MDVPPSPPPQGDNPIITQFEPRGGQWELNDENIKRIDPENGQTILHNYCKYINTTPFEVYRYLIETKGCDINAQDNNKDTALHDALRHFDPNYRGDNIAVLTYLLTQKNVDVNIKDKYGYTVLHMACERINKLPITLFELLIALGADVNAQNDSKYTPIYLAFHRFDVNSDRDIAILTYLSSQKGIDGNIKGQYGYTILHHACERINILPLEIFKLLIETMSCDVNAQDECNATPIHHALRYFNPNDDGDITVLMYLLGHENVNVNTKGWDGNSLLHIACKKARKLPVDLFKLLIETHGADVNTQNDHKDTPIHYAFRRFYPSNGNNITVLAYLINQNNFNVNVKGQCGCTFLHLACKWDISELYDFIDPDDECTDSGDEEDVLEAKSDTVLSQIVESVAERCVEQVLDETTMK
jgi:ankyrin repeat protein